MAEAMADRHGQTQPTHPPPTANRRQTADARRTTEAALGRARTLSLSRPTPTPSDGLHARVRRGLACCLLLAGRGRARRRCLAARWLLAGCWRAAGGLRAASGGLLLARWFAGSLAAVRRLSAALDGGLARPECTRSLHGRRQGCGRPGAIPAHASPSQSERREGLGLWGGAVGSNSGHHPARHLNLLSRFHPLGFLDALREAFPSPHAAAPVCRPVCPVCPPPPSSVRRRSSTPRPFPAACLPHRARCPPLDHLRAAWPPCRRCCTARPPSSDLQLSCRPASICDTSPPLLQEPYRRTTTPHAPLVPRTTPSLRRRPRAHVEPPSSCSAAS